MAFMNWIPMPLAELGPISLDDGKRCIWKHSPCGTRCNRMERGHLDGHRHATSDPLSGRAGVCNITGQEDITVTGES